MEKPPAGGFLVSKEEALYPWDNSWTLMVILTVIRNQVKMLRKF
jgi:hypothetical protein